MNKSEVERRTKEIVSELHRYMVYSEELKREEENGTR